jgi:hypothetical protein
VIASKEELGDFEIADPAAEIKARGGLGDTPHPHQALSQQSSAVDDDLGAGHIAG